MIAFVRRIWRSGFTGAALLATALLSGCGTTSTVPPEPRIVIQEKLVPVTVPCVPSNVGAKPDYPDTAKALQMASPERRYQLLIAGREMRDSRLGIIEPVIEGCRK